MASGRRVVIRILCRAPGRTDIVLTLQPGHWERVDFAHAEGEYVYPPHVGILLLEGEDGSVVYDGYVDPQRPPATEQGELL